MPLDYSEALDAAIIEYNIQYLSLKETNVDFHEFLIGAIGIDKNSDKKRELQTEKLFNEVNSLKNELPNKCEAQNLKSFYGIREITDYTDEFTPASELDCDFKTLSIH